MPEICGYVPRPSAGKAEIAKYIFEFDSELALQGLAFVNRILNLVDEEWK